MSLPTEITGHVSSSIPPPGLNEFAKCRWAVKNPPADPIVSFAGKTVLVTGANAGLGFEAAVKYASKGCSRLLLGVRSASRGEETKQEIQRRSDRLQEDFIDILTVDLTSFTSVQTFAIDLDKITSSTGLHIALLNAGLASPTFAQGALGYETALQVNVLSTALMAILILPVLRRTASTGTIKDPPHLTFVNSSGHTEVEKSWYAATPHNGSLLAYTNDATAFDTRKHYCGVKLLGMSVMRHIASLTNSSDGPTVIVNACCPFLCRTALGRNFPLPQRVIGNAVQYFTARTAEQGARTLVGATVLGRESHGGWWTHDVLPP